MKPVHIILSSVLCAALAATAVLAAPTALEHFSKFSSKGKLAVLNLNEVVEANEAALCAQSAERTQSDAEGLRLHASCLVSGHRAAHTARLHGRTLSALEFIPRSKAKRSAQDF